MTHGTWFWFEHADGTRTRVIVDEEQPRDAPAAYPARQAPGYEAHPATARWIVELDDIAWSLRRKVVGMGAKLAAVRAQHERWFCEGPHPADDPCPRCQVGAILDGDGPTPPARKAVRMRRCGWALFDAQGEPTGVIWPQKKDALCLQRVVMPVYVKKGSANR